MSHFHSNALLGASGNQGYEIARSLRFNAGDGGFLHRTPSGAGNQKKYTISLWVKRTAFLASALDVSFLGAGDGTTYGISGTGAFGASLNGHVFMRNGGANVGYWDIEFRDPAAWTNFVLAIDTDQSTAANRNRLYVNGVEQGAPSANFGSGASTNINAASIHSIGTFNLPSSLSPFAGYFTNGYLAEYNFVDGSQLGPGSFGETDPVTGAWIPKKYVGTYGTNGFYLNFSDNSGVTATTLGKDSSGNGNNWTPVNFSVTAGSGNDSLEDTPTNNWCTLNPLNRGADNPTVSNGNLYLSSPSTDHTVVATFGIPSSGKWYWEYSKTAGSNLMSGIIYDPEVVIGSGLSTFLGGQANGYSVYAANGQKYNGAINATYMATPSTSTTITVAFDADTNELYFGADGNWGDGTGNTDQAFATAAVAYNVIPGKTYYPAISFNGGNAFANFGQRPFDHTPPTGYKALNAANLPVPTIKDGTEYFNTVLWTGNSSTQAITGVGFQPSFVWGKARSVGYAHNLFDAVRGATKSLVSSSTAAEITLSGLTSFDSDGFTLGSNLDLNLTTHTYVAWNWKAGGSGSANTDGTISSTVSVNAEAGFSIVSYTGNATTGATVGHGLSNTPSMYIIKDRDSVSNWLIFNDNLSTNNNLYLNTTDAQFAAGGFAGMGATSSLIQLPTGGTSTVNESGKKYIALVFSEVEGYSKFGSYSGNGSSTSGTFVSLPFRPAFVIMKKTSGTDNWEMKDNTRDPENPVDSSLFPNAASAESTGRNIDFLSNGFKHYNANGNTNENGHTYIYMAFAERPFKYANAR